MKIGLVQFDIAWEDKAENQRRISALVKRCDFLGELEWLIFPEMTLTGFSMNLEKSTLNDQDMCFFRDLATKHHVYITFGGVREKTNHSFTLNPSGEFVGDYSKIHLFSFAKEDQAYLHGRETVRFFLNEVSVAPFVCYDLRFPYLFWEEALATEVFCVIASWPAKRIAHWEALLRARAIENQCFVIGVNRVGNDPQNEYCGVSCAFDPLGNLIFNGDSKNGIFFVELDLKMVKQVRSQFPFMKDRKGAYHLC